METHARVPIQRESNCVPRPAQPDWTIVRVLGSFVCARGYGVVTDVTSSRRTDSFNRWMATVEDLAGVPLFESLSDDDRKELAGWFDVYTVGEGAKLVGEGAAGYSFYVLIEGSAVVTTDGITVATYAPGDFFGEMAILGEGRRTATVTATSPAKLLVMFGTEFRQLQSEQPAIAARLEEAMQQRRQELLEHRSATTDPS